MKLFSIVSVLIGISFCSLANASVTFLPGNNPQPDESVVLFNQNAIGNPVFGEIDHTGLLVGFDSFTDLLLAPSNGQARLTSDDGAINNLSIYVPHGYYTDLIINPFLERQNGGGPAGVHVTTNDGVFDYYYSDGLQNGNNFLTILASGGEKILKTTINSTYGFEGLEGFGDLRQPRISGASCDIPTPAVPEPSSLALLCIGGGPMLAMLKRFRPKF